MARIFFATLAVVATVPAMPAHAAQVEYIVRVRTGDLKNAGTDANVFIVLIGTATRSKVRLGRGNSAEFERGNFDSFRIQAADVGEIKGVRISHDNAGNKPGWFLESLCVTYARGVTHPRGSDDWTFTVKRWLARDEGDGSIDVELSGPRVGGKSANNCLPGGD
jgi:lipoxygenase homology domain-containing protein 1